MRTVCVKVLSASEISTGSVLRNFTLPVSVLTPSMAMSLGKTSTELTTNPSLGLPAIIAFTGTVLIIVSSSTIHADEGVMPVMLIVGGILTSSLFI